jgi:hypothetical protein
VPGGPDAEPAGGREQRQADPEVPGHPLVDAAIREVDEDDEEAIDENELPGELLDAGELH